MTTTIEICRKIELELTSGEIVGKEVVKLNVKCYLWAEK